MANPNYNVDYNDERFTQVETQKQAALSEVEKTYDNMINQSDSYYQAKIDASKQWAQQQQQIQQDQTDFTIEQIEQQKKQAQEDYTKEQSAAYIDYQKQSNKFGAEAEQMASSGLTNTGFSESSQVSMYNTYQNRVASARETVNQAMLNYNNAIKDAQLQNNSALAEIAYQALQQELELSLEGFQYQNSLIAEQLSQKQATEDRYYNRYQNVLAQINQEHALAEEVRQYNENLALQREQLTEEKRQYEQNYALQKQQLAKEQAAAEEAYKIQKQQYDASIAATGNTKTTTTTKSSNASTAARTYGTFSNGQPKGIVGYGKLTETADNIYINGKWLKLYKTDDGARFYWDATNQKYQYVKKMSTGGSKSGGGGGALAHVLQ